MALPSTGAISLLDVRNELGKTGAISLGDSAVRTLAGKTSGAISLGDLRGKSSKIKHYIDFICGEFDFRAQAGPTIISIGSGHGYGRDFDYIASDSMNILKRKSTIYSKSSDFELYIQIIQGRVVVCRLSFTNNNLPKGRIRVTVKSPSGNVVSEYNYDQDAAGQVDPNTISRGSALYLSQYGANRIQMTFEQI